MKVIIAVVLALGSVSALGSGPYLPSGWRPQGPAFFLPGEAQKPAESPLKETIIFETQASGSNSLREYGPPKAQEVNVINQGLPDVVTDQTFLIVEDRGAVSAVVLEENSASEVSVEQKSDLVQEQTTEVQLAEEKATEVIQRLADIELQNDYTTASYADLKYEEIQPESKVKSEDIQATEAVTTEEVEATVAAVEERLGEVVVEQAVVEEGVKNIAEALVNLESEIKAKQSVEVSAEVRQSQEGSGSAQVPEGFLEYGPPGFREYGPPKSDLLRSAVVVQEPTFETNEARKRRFSPKFRAQKNKRIH